MKKQNICGEKVKNLRESQDLTIESLVSLMNSFGSELTVQELSDIETYNRKIYDTEIVCICKIFNITADSLLKKDLIAK